MKTLVKILLWTVAVVIGLPLLVLVLSPLWRKPWIEPLPGVRLTPARPVIAEKDLPPDSAFMRFRKAEAVFVKPEALGIDRAAFMAETRKLFLVPWAEETFPAMPKMLAANEESLRLMREAIAIPNPQVPSLTHIEDRADYLTAAQGMSNLLRASAARNLSRNSTEAALNDLLTIIRLGDMFTRGSPTIHQLVDMAMMVQALSSIRMVCLTSDVPTGSSSNFARALTKIEHDMEPWPETVRWEATCVPEVVRLTYSKSSLEDLVRKTGPGMRDGLPTVRPSLLPLALLAGSKAETTRENVETVYAHLIKLAETPENIDASSKFDEELYAKFKGPRSFLELQDPVGLLVARLILPIGVGVNVRHVERLAALRATQAVIAIRQFQQANARLPGSLAELVPRFLPSVPEDPFDHKPLRYIRKSDTAWAVYSVGRNRIDDGGKEPKSEYAYDKRDADLVFSSTEAADALAKLNAEKPAR